MLTATYLPVRAAGREVEVAEEFEILGEHGRGRKRWWRWVVILMPMWGQVKREEACVVNSGCEPQIRRELS